MFVFFVCFIFEINSVFVMAFFFIIFGFRGSLISVFVFCMDSKRLLICVLVECVMGKFFCV